MEYGLPQLKKYPIDTEENIHKCVKYFHHCPENLKEALANNIYRTSLREGIIIDGNSELFRYVDFTEEISNEEYMSNAPKLNTDIERNRYKDTKNKVDITSENSVAGLAIANVNSTWDNKYIDNPDYEEDNEVTDFNESANIGQTYNIKDLLGDSNEEILTEAPKNKKRQEMESLIYDFFNIIDITGMNTKKYKDMLGTMTDEQFDKYMKKFLNNDDLNFYLEVLPNKNEPNLKQIKKCADLIKVPLDEYVYYRHDGDKDNPLRTSYKVPVGLTIGSTKILLTAGTTLSF